MSSKYVSLRDNNPLDQIIYIDTDILVNVFARGWGDTGKRRSQECRLFLDRAANEDALLAVSLQTYAELRKAIFAGMYSRLAYESGAEHAKAAFAQAPDYTQKVHAEIDRIEGLINAMPNIVPLETPIDEVVMARALGMMYQYHLEPADAVHVVLANLNSINTFATTDRMWGELSGARIYTPHEDLVQKTS